MLPVIFEMSNARVLLIGRGAALLRRVKQVGAAGAAAMAVFTDEASAELQEAAAGKVEMRWPDDADFAGARMAFVAGLETEDARPLCDAARGTNVPVNVEDVPGLCDFHVPSMVRRGDLLITVSTGGKAPGLAGKLREKLEKTFGPEWADRLAHVAAERNRWRADGADMKTVAARTEKLVDESGWLK